MCTFLDFFFHRKCLLTVPLREEVIIAQSIGLGSVSLASNGIIMINESNGSVKM